MLQHENGPIDSTGQEKLARSSFVIIAILIVATFVVNLNETILGVALPKVMGDLKIQPSTGQWLNTSYLITMAVVIPVTGFLQQRFSTRALYSAAMLAFSVGTLIGGIAPTFEILLVARIFQAAGSAVMFPLLITTMMTLVPDNLRGRIMGNIGILMSVAPALGPAASGLILSFLGWRWLFWLILPIALVTSFFGARRIKPTDNLSKASVDVFSVILSAFAFAGLIYGLSSFGEAARGHAAVSPWVPLGVGSVAMTIFILRQIKLAKTDRALLNLNTFKYPTFTISTALMGIAMMFLFGLGILIPIYTQQALGFSPLETGLILLPGGLAMGLLSPVVGRLFDAVGSKKLLIPGAIALSASFWYMTTFDVYTQNWQILVAFTAMSVSLAFMFTPLFAMSMSSVEPKLYSHASATVGSIQQIFGAAGTALFIVILTVVSVSATNNGKSASESIALGAHSAIISGAMLSLLVVVLAFLLKESTQTKSEVPLTFNE